MLDLRREHQQICGKKWPSNIFLSEFGHFPYQIIVNPWKNHTASLFGFTKIVGVFSKTDFM